MLCVYMFKTTHTHIYVLNFLDIHTTCYIYIYIYIYIYMGEDKIFIRKSKLITILQILFYYKPNHN